jgi:hypothetical protein
MQIYEYFDKGISILQTEINQPLFIYCICKYCKY